MRFFSILLAASLLFLSCASQSTQRVLSASSTPSTVILISMDGFRWDYLEKFGQADTPYLHQVIRNGVRAKSLKPVFPSVTFPNHYSLVTGLYAEHHGIVANEMWDPKTKKRFHIKDENAVNSSEWWEGEPIWVTAEKQGVITASMFWVGSTALIQGRKPTYSEPYDEKVSKETRVNKVLGWLDLPPDKRPRFITLYFEDADSKGHQAGPDSEAVRDAVRGLDATIGTLLSGLKLRGLEKSVELVFVSDHGMANVERANRINLVKLLSEEEARVVGGGAFVSIWPKLGKESIVLEKLNKLAHVQVIEKNKMPKRFHYSVHRRIPPILVLAEEGWYLKTSFKIQELLPRIGSHGYDNELPSMHGVFFAQGPQFKKQVTRGTMENVDLYELLCHLLKIHPAKNDGEFARVRDVLLE